MIALLSLTACDGDLTISTGPRGFSARGGTGSSTQPAILIGRWQRTVIFNDASGLNSSETTWEFRADGIAIRTVVAKNITHGLSDVVVSTGRWSATGRTITIVFASTPGFVQLDFIVFGNVLTLNGQDFVRIG
ncbi:MAG TPA: hypothetical protein VJ672_10825 [Gemmatimonadaceae bacterium]|nr:hypothetical protein [Gemmatimonadaceae bacterium]